MTGDTPKKSKHYNPQSPRKSAYKKPPTFSELAHIPFTEMEATISVESAKVNSKAFEAELMELLVKHKLLDENESGYDVCNGRRLSIAFPNDPRDKIHVDIQQNVGDSGRWEYRTFIYDPRTAALGNRPAITRSVITYPETFNQQMRYDLTNIRRTFSVGVLYQPTQVQEPDIYEGVESNIKFTDGSAVLTKTFVIDGVRSDFMREKLPADKYLLLNGITTLPEPEVRQLEE